MNTQTFNITGEDFRDAFKREQDALRIDRANRLNALALILAEAKDDFATEYGATFECPASEGHSEANSAELDGQRITERLFWLWENVINQTYYRAHVAANRAAATEYLESALEAITEAIDDRERANVIAAAAHLELFRLHDLDLPAHAKARVEEMRARIAASKGAA